MSTIKGLSALLCQLAYLVGELFPIRQDEQVILRSVTCRRQVHLPFGELQENFQITDPLVTSLWKGTLDFRWKMSFRCFLGIRNGTC
jgi:hypothetical protein